MNKPILALQNLSKTFETGEGPPLTIFRDLNLTLRPGEIVGLLGQSGSGKTTLLQLAGLLDTPSAGKIIYEGQDAHALNDHARTLLRRKVVGFVYQFHHLLPEFSALENVIMPQMIANVPYAQARAQATRLLTLVGLDQRLSHRPARLSGGEQQRVAIVRALANHPKLLLADEPTGNLDPQTADRVFGLLLSLVRNAGICALIATHNVDLAARMDRVVRLEQGRIVE